MVKHLAPEQYRDIVARALHEDLGAGDITTDATVGGADRARGVFVVKTDCVIAGLEVAFEAFRQLDPQVQTNARKRDGDRCAPGDEIATVTGLARALLT